MQPQQNPYSFIMQDQQRYSAGGPASKLKRLLVLVMILVVLGVAVIVGLYALGAGSRKMSAQIQELYAYQNDLIRLSELGEENARTTEATSLAITARLTILSNQRNLSSITSKKGINTEEKTLEAKYDFKEKTIDGELDSAAKNNRYDEAFKEIYFERLTSYQKLLKSIYNGTSSKKDKAIYEKLFNDASTLIGTNSDESES